ncbi:MAG: D-alanyl-D-alanine carboxypeptidase/D-alanyl-D-alanine-endopeptidase [Ignavibacteriae bacterium]|nr:D-alanyl-D-alanine carboxypeptidase/D-alanyl-D-alanine-endopeptidase [Ignavibacteriota bacterium]
MKNYFFVISILLFQISLYAQDYNSEIVNEINKILEDEYFESTSFSVSIFDLTDNKNLYEKNQKLLLHPASNMKVLTSAAGLEYLGADYTFNTSVHHTGIIMDSVCYGDIFISGGFDPDFTSKDLDTLVFALKEFGINEIRGNVYGDISNMDSLFWGNGWMWDDDPSSDFPYMTPLIINDACIEIAYEPGLIGKPVHFNLIPQTDFFDITNTAITTKEDTSDFEITRDWLHRGNEIFIKGDLSYRSRPDTVKINIVNPEYYFLFLLKEKLEANSVKFLGRLDTLTLPEYSKIIYEKKRKYADIIDNLNKESDNLSAEMTLRALALKNFGKPASAENGIDMIDSLIRKTNLNYKNYKMVDGSGISHYNLVSSELLVEVLKYMFFKSPQNYEMLKNSFPIAGIDGTLENRMKKSKAYRNVRAKTGTLSGVSTLSGYLKSANNHDIAFSIFFQNFKGSARVARNYQDRICKFLSDMKIRN